MKRFFIFLAMALWSAVCHAQGGSHAVLGQGSVSCETWIQERAKRSQFMERNITWVTGYLTAYNVFVSISGDLTEGLEPEQILEKLDWVCRKIPKLSLADATLAMAIKIEEAQREARKK